MHANQCFVCYVHDDDTANMGGILQLARDLESEFAAITAGRLEMVYDRMHLQWGDDWRSELTDAVGRATFLMPFISPRFFLSQECRREFDYFRQTALHLGRGQLVLPILYIEIEGLSISDPDPIKAAIAGTQYEDWTDLRFAERHSSEYRRGVNRLARALWSRIAALPDPSPPVIEAVQPPSIDASEDAPGLLDLIAENEDSVDAMTESLNKMAEITREFGELAERYTSQLSASQGNNQSQTLARRLVVINQYAKELDPLASRLESEVSLYRRHLEGVDALYGALFEMGTAEPNREVAKELALSVISLSSSAVESFEAADGLISAAQVLENYSRAVRAPTRRFRQAMQSLRDTEPTIVAWGQDARTLLDRLQRLEIGNEIAPHTPGL